MKLELIRQYRASSDKFEFLFEIDSEFIEMYKEETGEKEITKEGFSEFINNNIKELLKDEEWRG